MRFIALFVAVVVGCVGMTACSGGQASEPIFSDPPSQTPAPSESATPKQESAQDFIRRFVAAGDDMQNSLDTTAYRSMYSRDCENCEKVADLIDKIANAGGAVEFDGSKVLWIKGHGTDYRYRLLSGQTDYSESAGATPIHLDGSEVTNTIQLTRIPDGWRVAYFAQIAGSAS